MSIKIKSISGFNFAGYSSIMMNLDQSITYLIGPNGAGKTVRGLDLVWFVMQGIAEKSSDGKIPLIGERFRFIGKDGATALAELHLYDDVRKCDIRVIRKLLKSGTELTFSAPAGMELDQQWLNDLFNIFLISPKRFIDLSSKDQAVALGIDTKIFDDKIAALKIKFSEINKALGKFDNIVEVEKVERPKLEELQQEKAEIKQRLANELLQLQNGNKSARQMWENAKLAIDEQTALHNKKQDEILKKFDDCRVAYETLKLHGLVSQEVAMFLDGIQESQEEKITAAELYPKEPEYKPEQVDETDLVAIDEKLLAAAGQGERALLYEQYLEKLEEKGQLELQLQQNKNDQTAENAKRLEYIKAFDFPFSKLSVGDDGGLLLDEKPLKPAYFSSGELIRIVPSLIASRNPEFKYVFIQEANLIDAENLVAIEKELTGQGFQLVLEYVGKEKLQDKNCIVLSKRPVAVMTESGPEFLMPADDQQPAISLPVKNTNELPGTND